MAKIKTTFCTSHL